jgi:hypothetical protein
MWCDLRLRQVLTGREKGFNIRNLMAGETWALEELS